MEAAAEAARCGRLAHFEELGEGALASLLARPDEDGRSLPHHAAAGGALPVLNFLLGRGADCNTSDEEVRLLLCHSRPRSETSCTARGPGVKRLRQQGCEQFRLPAAVEFGREGAQVGGRLGSYLLMAVL